jgi:hypothetical protein
MRRERVKWTQNSEEARQKGHNRVKTNGKNIIFEEGRER